MRTDSGLTPGAPPPPATPTSQWIAKLRPFTLARQSQFRADGPPDLESAQWAEDYNEVKVWGASKLDGTARSGSGSGR